MYVTKARENALVYICNLITFSVFINFFPNFKKILCCFFYNISKHYLYKNQIMANDSQQCNR